MNFSVKLAESTAAAVRGASELEAAARPAVFTSYRSEHCSERETGHERAGSRHGARAICIVDEAKAGA